MEEYLMFMLYRCVAGVRASETNKNKIFDLDFSREIYENEFKSSFYVCMIL
jgi:hypothetical protein